MIGAFAAKEIFVAQMGIVYSIGDADKGTRGAARGPGARLQPARRA